MASAGCGNSGGSGGGGGGRAAYRAAQLFLGGTRRVLAQYGFEVGRGDEAGNQRAIFENDRRRAGNADLQAGGEVFADDVGAIATRVGQRLVSFGEQERGEAVGRTPHLRHPQRCDGFGAAAREGEVADSDAALGVFKDVLLHDAAIGAVHVDEHAHLMLRRGGRDTNHRLRVNLRQRLDPLGGAEDLGDIALRLQVNHLALHHIAAIGADVEHLRPLRELVQSGNRRFLRIAHHARVEDRFRQLHVGRGGVREGGRGDEQTGQGSHGNQRHPGENRLVSYRQQHSRIMTMRGYYRNVMHADDARQTPSPAAPRRRAYKSVSSKDCCDRATTAPRANPRRD